MVHQRKWYAVITGTEPGVYPTWTEAGPKTKNIPGGSIHQSFPSEAEAIRAFEAAKARGDVEAYPDAGKKDKSTGKSKNALLLSPFGPEASLLRTPLDLKVEVESTGTQTPLSSPTRSRVAELRRTLKHPIATDSCSTVFSSPQTHVTRVNSPAVYNGPINSPAARPSPHFTFTSSSSRAYSDVSDGRLPELDIREMPLQLDVSDWDSESPPSPQTPLVVSDSHPGAEEHTPKPSRCMPPHLDPPSRSKGVKYRGLAGLADMASVDPRIWLPKSRVFDPDKVKPRPLTRPPSPEKRDASPVPSHDTVGGSPQLQRQISSVDSPFVRTGRGRHLKLTPSLSLPILPDREIEDKCLSCGSLLGDHRTGKREEKEPDYPAPDKDLAEQPTGCSTSPRNDSRSHIQLVPRDGRDEQSAIVVYCPPNCSHESCFRSTLVEPSGTTGSQYVDACVSPIITTADRTQGTDSPAKIRSKRPELGGDDLCELAGFTHVSHQARGIAPEADVRSPIARGTMVPMNTVEMGRVRRRYASRARRLARLTGLLALSDLACFSVVLTATVLMYFWALQNTVWTTLTPSTGF